jgi:hypothetical protein
MAFAQAKRTGGLSMAEGSTTVQNLPSTGLLLVGMGPGSVGAMTIEAVEAAAAATHRRYEAYTALWPDDELNLLEQTIGPIQRVMRPEVEQPEDLFALASTSLVALLVVGDPLQATTHVDLQLQAAEAGIECRVFTASLLPHLSRVQLAFPTTDLAAKQHSLTPTGGGLQLHLWKPSSSTDTRACTHLPSST